MKKLLTISILAMLTATHYVDAATAAGGAGAGIRPGAGTRWGGTAIDRPAEPPRLEPLDKSKVFKDVPIDHLEQKINKGNLTFKTTILDKPCTVEVYVTEYLEPKWSVTWAELIAKLPFYLEMRRLLGAQIWVSPAGDEKKIVATLDEAGISSPHSPYYVLMPNGTLEEWKESTIEGEERLRKVGGGFYGRGAGASAGFYAVSIAIKWGA